MQNDVKIFTKKHTLKNMIKKVCKNRVKSIQKTYKIHTKNALNLYKKYVKLIQKARKKQLKKGA